MYNSELALMRPDTLQFAEFELDRERYELHCGNRRVELERMPMELLILLIDRQGGMVERDEIVEKLWGRDKFVDATQGINTAIKKVRLALKDDPQQPRFIQTVRGRGYRFMAPLQGPEPVSADSNPAASISTASHHVSAAETHLPARRPVRRILFWGAVMLSVALLGTVLFELNRNGWRNSASGIGALKPAQSVAVLPLVNLSHDPNKDYFADGLTDELITNLAQISSMRVISHTSVMQYKEAKKPLPEIARELNVDVVVEGSVLQADGKVRITAQLLDARTDRHLWARSYIRDESDVVTIQSDVARDIGHEIALKLVPRQALISQNKPVSAEAFDSYLRGRYFWNQRTLAGLNHSILYYEQALKADPGYAKAYAALGDAYVVLSSYGGPGPSQSLLRARAPAEKALQLDGTLAEAYTVLAAVKVGYDWDWKGGEREFRRALELNPGYANAHHWYALHLSRMGRFKEAEFEMQRALELDPLSSIINTDAAEVFYCARQPQEAMARLRRSLEMEPNFAKAHLVLGKVYEEKKEFAHAIAEFDTASKLFSGSPRVETLRAHALALSGKPVDARKIVNRVEALSTQRYVSSVDIGSVYCALGETSTASRWFRKAYENRDKGVNTLGSDPLFDGCRSDSRFRDLLVVIHLAPSLGSTSTAK